MDTTSGNPKTDLRVSIAKSKNMTSRKLTSVQCGGREGERKFSMCVNVKIYENELYIKR